MFSLFVSAIKGRAQLRAKRLPPSMPISAHTDATTGQDSDWNWRRAYVKKTSMKLTLEEVEWVAGLARLRLTSEEKERLTEQLDNILRYMEKLNQLDISGVEPFIHAVNVTAPLREDRVTTEPNTETLLANAPARDGTFFRVPKIIE